MPVVLARIDQRLVHGITVNDWNAKLNPKRFMVVDDTLSTDDVVKGSMRMSKPAGTGMSIISTETAITNFKAGKYDDHLVFILVKEPATLLTLAAGGVEIPAVNVGMIFAEDDRVPVTSRVFLNQAEAADLQKLAAQGIDVSFQYRPTDDKVALSKALEGKEL